MAAFAITVCVLSGEQLQVITKPSEQVADVRREVENAIGVTGLQEVKLYIRTEELCYDALVTESGLQEGSEVQAVVTKSVRKAKEVLQSFSCSFSSKFPKFKAPPPPLPHLPSLRPFSNRKDAAFIREPAPQVLSAIHAIDKEAADAIPALDVMEEMNAGVADVQALAKMFNNRSSHLAIQLLAHACVAGGCGRPALEMLRDRLSYSSDGYHDNWGDESAIWVKLIHALAPRSDLEVDSGFGHHEDLAEALLCLLASKHPAAEVRAAAVRAIAFLPPRGLEQISGFQQVSQRDPEDSVRAAASEAIAAVRAEQAKGHLPPTPPAMPTPLVLMPPPPPAPAAPPPPAVTVATARSAPHEKDEEKAASQIELQEALRQSEAEDLQRETRDVQEALLRSKADTWNADGVTLSRLTFHTPDVVSFLCEVDGLAGCRSRVENAGCELRPVWANGALLLVPATEEQILEAGIQLKPHNILMLSSDVQLVESTLSQLPRRKRPQLKPERLAVDSPQTAQAQPQCSTVGKEPPARGSAGGQQAAAWMQDVGLVVERTFLNFPLEKEISDASTIVQSAPAAGAASSEHINPHQWRLPKEEDSGLEV